MQRIAIPEPAAFPGRLTESLLPAIQRQQIGNSTLANLRLARVEFFSFLGQDAGVDQFYEHFGQRVRSARLNLGLNQEALGHRVGLERSSISNVEKGRQRVQLHMLLEFAAALDVKPLQLLPDTSAASDPLRRVPAETRPFVDDVLKRARARARD
jgi:transcriptional regulator with XRE-family HTH domain